MYGTTITITDKSQPAFNLFSVLTGAVTGITVGTSGKYPGISRNCRELILQADTGNGAGKIMLGDASVTTTNYGMVLAATAQPIVLRADLDAISLSDIFFTTDTNTSKLNVVWLYL